MNKLLIIKILISMKLLTHYPLNIKEFRIQFINQIILQKLINQKNK